jgi:hypothetical protein
MKIIVQEVIYTDKYQWQIQEVISEKEIEV